MARYAAARGRHARRNFWLGVGALVVAGAVTAALASTVNPFKDALLRAALTVLPFAALLLLPRAGPRAFEVGAESIRVVKGWVGSEVIPVPGIRAVVRLPPELGRQVFRGYVFAAHSWLGTAIVHATRGEELVLIDTEFSRYVLSPEPVQPFLDELLALAPPGVLRSEVPPPVGGRGLPLPKRLVTPLSRGALVVIVVALVALLAFSRWAKEPCGVTVSGGSVLIARRAAGDIEILVKELRGVSRLDAEAVRGARSLDGLPAMLLRDVAHGRFVSAGLGRFRMFAWRDGPYVRIDLGDEPVVLTPDDPDGFVAALEARMGR